MCAYCVNKINHRYEQITFINLSACKFRYHACPTMKFNMKISTMLLNIFAKNEKIEEVVFSLFNSNKKYRIIFLCLTL